MIRSKAQVNLHQRNDLTRPIFSQQESDRYQRQLRELRRERIALRFFDKPIAKKEDQRITDLTQNSTLNPKMPVWAPNC